MSDAAVASIVTGVVTVTTIVIGFFSMWVKYKYGVEKVEKKIRENTEITRSAASNAENAATKAETGVRVAAQSADATKQAVDKISKKLNGGIDEAIAAAIDPVSRLLQAHTEKDAKDIEEVHIKIEKLDEYIHQRNHDILGALNTQNLKLQIIIEKLGLSQEN